MRSPNPAPAFLLPLVLLSICFAQIARADPVDEFVATTDRLFTGGQADSARVYVLDHPELLGAVVGRLIDVAWLIEEQNPDGAQENIDFVRRLVAFADDSAAESMIEDFERLRARHLTERRAVSMREARARATRDEGDPALAQAQLDSCRMEYEQLGDHRAVAKIWGQCGISSWRLGDFRRARDDYTQALRSRRAIGDRMLEGNALNSLGSVNARLGELESAVEWYEEAIELRQRIGDQAGLGTSLSYCANVLTQLGRLDEASEHYRRASEVLLTAGDPRPYGELLIGWGNLLHQMGDYPAAQQKYRRALQLIDEDGASLDRVLLLTNLANSQRFGGDLLAAMSSIAGAREASSEDTPPDTAVRMEMERSMIALQLGEHAMAREAVVGAIRRVGELQDPGLVVDVHLTTATVYRDLGALQRALPLAEEAVRTATELQDPLRLRDAQLLLASCQRRVGQLAEAATHVKLALASDQSDERTGLVLEDQLALANIESEQGESSKARHRFREALGLVGRTGRSDLAWIAILGIGDTFESENPDSAAVYYQRAMQWMDSDRGRMGGAERRSSFLQGDRGSAYEGIVRFLAQQYVRTGEDRWGLQAMAAADRAKARGLRASLGKRLLLSGTESELDQLRSQLAEGDAVLAYSVGDSTSYLWCLHRDGWGQYSLPGREWMRAQVRRMRDALGSGARGEAELRRVAHELYYELVQPAVQQLVGTRRIRIVRDDALYQLPFAALLREDADDSTPWGELSWFDEQASICYSPALVFVADATTDRAGPRAPHSVDLVALGGASFSSIAPLGRPRPLSPLPHTLEEVRDIEPLFVRDRALILTGEQATEGALKKALAESSPRILHLATHGVVEPYDPEASCIAMGVDADEDGYWYTTEVAQSGVAAELVVLSACESAVGKVERGEGVVGLARTFLSSGCQSVLASLWEVSDRSTELLMVEFYRALMREGVDAAEALRRASRQLRRSPDTAHPFHWAPFVLSTTR